MSASRKRKKGVDADSAPSTFPPNNDDAHLQWEDVKKARNRINSQRTREREKFQLESLESEKTRLTLSNDALIFQNNHFRESIRQIAQVQKLRRARATAGQENSSSNEVANPPQNPLSSLPIVSVDLATGAVGSRGITAAGIDQEAYLAPVRDPLRYSGLERGLGSFPSSIQIPGSSSSLDDLRVRHQAVLEAEAAMLHRQRVAEIGSLRAAVPPITRSSSLMVNLPTGMLPPLDIMEIRARQLRMQELERAVGRGVPSTDVMLRYPHRIQAPDAIMFNPHSLRGMHEDSKQDSRHAEERKAKSRKYKK
jgi:hypothetical protein